MGMDVFVTAELGLFGASLNGASGIARALQEAGYPVRTVVVLDRDTGLAGTCYTDRGGI